MDDLNRPVGADIDYEISEDADGSPRVILRGELDMSSSPELDAKIAPIIARSPERLVIDASGLEFADSSGIALFVSWANQLKQVEIQQPPELLRQVIARMGLSGRLHLTP
jgi:anti-anti-sigma factor